MLNPMISSKFLEVEQRKIHYLTAGFGPVVLLLHGWPSSSFLWRDIMPTLAENHQVIAIDLPGFGQSDKRMEDSYSFRFYQKMLDGFLAKLGIEKLTLGVHDLGGPLGLFWAVENQTKIERLILFNTLVYPELSWAVKLFGLSTRIPFVKNWLTSPEGIKRAMYFGIHQKEKLDADAIQHYQAPFQEKNARKVLLKTVQGLHPKGFVTIAEKLGKFDCPVQIIYGEKDRILPDVAHTMQRVKKDLAQAKITALPNCGHFLQEEAADEIASIVKEFLQAG